MSAIQPLFLLFIFLVAAFVTYIVVRQFMPTPVEQHVAAVAGSAAAPHASRTEQFARWLAPFAKPSLPEGGWEQSPLRIRFFNAGLRSPSAPVVYFGAKTLLTFVLPALLLFVVSFVLPGFAVDTSKLHTMKLLPAVFVLAACGYYLPNMVLAHLVKQRQRELFEAFPDALDLMRVCVEAGLGLDAALERVGSEMALESPALSEEFHLVSLELRAGASRADALRNLALRVALEDVDALVSMLVQADRFGTSIAESLRVHAQGLRDKRRLIAEEKAAKLPVNLLFPLIFGVFPSLMAVLLGPVAVAIYRTLLQTVFHR